MDSAARLKAYAKQKGCCDLPVLCMHLTAKQSRRYCKKWWRDTTPAEHARYERYLAEWEESLKSGQ